MAIKPKTDDRNSKKTSSKRRKEVETLDTPEHQEDLKRLRAYARDVEDGDPKRRRKDNNDDAGAGSSRRRTRSMDAAEESQVLDESLDAVDPTVWRKEHAITITGHGQERSTTKFPDPFYRFTDAPFNQRIMECFARAGFEKPTPIQSQAWPIALKGKDMICIAKTGSGKTCGFLLPSFHRYLENNGRAQGYTKPVLLVLAPTRELSVQILEEAQKFGRNIGIRSVCTYGGSAKMPQIAALQRGVECIIATPGRLNDLLEMRKVDLSAIQFLVLDEADRMLDMGFEPQIRSIIKHIPVQRQTLLFSATWPREIQNLAHEFLKDPIQINVGEVNALVANKDIKQTIIMCSEDEKFDKLTEILKELAAENAGGEKESLNGKPRSNTIAGGGKEHAKVIVFVAKKVSCHNLSNRLWDDGFAVDSLHGDRLQWERTRVMQAFKSGVLRILVATDVAARGLDVKDVGVVVNYDMPSGVNGIEDYVHRIGRTGRAGAKGTAYSFFTPDDKKRATQLVEVMRKSDQVIPPELEAMVRPRNSGPGSGHRGYGRGYRGRGGGRDYMNSGRGYMGGDTRRGRGSPYGRGGGGFSRGRGGGFGGGRRGGR